MSLSTFYSSKHAFDPCWRNVHNMFNSWLLTTWCWHGVRLDVPVCECQSWKAKEYERIHRSQYFVTIQWIGAKLLLASMGRCFVPPSTTQIFSRQSTNSGFNVCLKAYITEHLGGAMPIWIRQCPPNITESVIHGYNSNKAHKLSTKVMEAKNWSEHIHNECSSSLVILPSPRTTSHRSAVIKKPQSSWCRQLAMNANNSGSYNRMTCQMCAGSFLIKIKNNSLRLFQIKGKSSCRTFTGTLI